MFESLYDYLTKKELKAIDVIAITVISSFLFTYGNKILISAVKFIHTTSKKLYYRCRLNILNWINMFKGKELTVYYYEKIKERLDKGGNLRCYEKKSYIKSRRSAKRMERSAKEFVKSMEKRHSNLENVFKDMK